MPYMFSLSSASGIMHKAMLVCREGGLIAEIRRWWDTHNTFGPDFDYLPIAKKCWIMAKPDTVESVRAAFEDTAVNVMVEGLNILEQ